MIDAPTFYFLDHNRILLKGEWDYKVQKSLLKNLQNAFSQNIKFIDFDLKASIDFAFGVFLIQQISQMPTRPKITANEKINKTLLLCNFKESSVESKNPESMALDSKDLESKFKDSRFYAESKMAKFKANSLVKFVLMHFGFLADFKYLGLKNFMKDFFTSFIDFINFTGICIYYSFLWVKTKFLLLMTFLSSKIKSKNTTQESTTNSATQEFKTFANKIHIKSIFHHINESGFKALPVSLLACFIIGFAITLQAIAQLMGFGAPLMAVEMGAKLTLREIGPFVLALVIAGRSASSFSAQIGAMQITDELDAMKTMGFNPVYFLVIPRLIALSLILPLLVFLADIAALLGGVLAIYLELDMGMSMYFERLYETVGVRHFWIGIIKAPFFGAAIALVGCFRGFCTQRDAQELGKLTTISVVNALFWVIVIDAIFSFITIRMGI